MQAFIVPDIGSFGGIPDSGTNVKCLETTPSRSHFRQVVGVENPEYHFTGYEWCRCGDLRKIIDPLGRITSWKHDAQGRVTSKTFPDRRSETYDYELKAGRLGTVTDSLSQQARYQYFGDNALKQVDYTSSERAGVSVGYTYESDYPRLATMTDSQGATNYAYNPVGVLGAGKVATIDGPLSNDTITYSYDTLGRSAGQAINGVGSTPTYDGLGRVDTVTNALGLFGYNYDGVSSRLSSIVLPNGQQTTFGYYDNLGDRALSNITHLTSGGGLISKYDYGYSAPGRLGDWTQQRGSQSPAKYTFGYDNVDQLKDATSRDVGTQAVLKRFAYRYDFAGNRTSEQIDNLVATEKPNSLNQLTERTAGGRLKVSGALTEPASVTVNGVPASVDASNQFEGSAAVTSGNNQFDVVATDGNGNRTTQRYQVNVPAAATVTQAYDFNGNLIQSTINSQPSTTYEWDAANRLTAINNGTGRSEFEYDGLSRRVHIVEKQSGTVISDKRFVWSGKTIGEERDNANNTTKRFFGDGVQLLGGGSPDNKYYYNRDRTGSVRELVDSAGVVATQYDYDPFGRASKVSGNVDSDFGFAGYYRHAPTALWLSPTRLYDSGTGKWISRDPIAEIGGSNIYAYVGNNTPNMVDPSGLWYALNPATWGVGTYEGVSGGWDNYRAQDFADGAYAGLDGLIPFADPFAQNGFYDPCDKYNHASQLLGKLSQIALTNAGGLAAVRGLNTLFMPQTLYHFTSVEGLASIEATGGIQAGGGLYGAGTYLTGFNSTTMAAVQGARSTAAVVEVATQGLPVSATYFPGTYIVRGASVLIP